MPEMTRPIIMKPGTRYVFVYWYRGCCFGPHVWRQCEFTKTKGGSLTYSDPEPNGN